MTTRSDPVSVRPVVSVVMATHNRADFLAAAMGCILRQTLAALELIVVDDGSTDRTPEVVGAVSDPRLIYVRNERNLGVAAAVNRGFALCRGEYIARMDDDDLCDNRRFELQVAFMQERKELAFSGTFALEFDRPGNIIHRLERPVGAQAVREWAYEHGIPVVNPSVIYRAAALREVGLYDTRFRIAEDYDLILRLLEKFDGDNLPEFLYRYRRHPGSMTWSDCLLTQAYADLARDMSVVRRGAEVGSREAAWKDISRRFEDIHHRRFPRHFRARVHRQGALAQFDRRKWWAGLKHIVNALAAEPFSRDNLWALRQIPKYMRRGRGKFTDE